MSASRALCISRDPAFRAQVDASLGASGLSVEHWDDLPPSTEGAALLVIDRATRELAGIALTEVQIPVVVVGDDLDDDSLITLMIEAPVSHLVSDPRSRELRITSEKLVSGDLFGLEKYLATSARTFERAVDNDAGKRSAIAEVAAWAE